MPAVRALAEAKAVNRRDLGHSASAPALTVSSRSLADMSDLNEVGDRDAWRCWLCDEPVDPEASVNADRGPSVDSGAVTKANAIKGNAIKGNVIKGNKGLAGAERLAHRSCNTQKGKIAPVVPWAADLFVVDPAPIVATVDRLARKGGQEVVARCPTRADAADAAAWLLDRLSRFAPDLALTTQIDEGGGQFLLKLRAV